MHVNDDEGAVERSYADGGSSDTRKTAIAELEECALWFMNELDSIGFTLC